MALNHHDQEIVDLYHEGSTDEPPPRLDAAILSAAREALAASPTPSAAQRKTGWWKRFSVPAQFAVSFMLVAMLLAGAYAVLSARRVFKPIERMLELS